MANYEITDAVTSDIIHELAVNLRHADREELNALGHSEFEKVIADSVASSKKSWAAFVDGRVALIAGVAVHPTDENIGIPWMLGTDLLLAHKKQFVRITSPYLALVSEGFVCLANAVHVRNSVSIAWLKRLGFTINDAAPFGPHNQLFHIFQMRV